MKMPSSQSGMSLLELSIVLTIVGIIAAGLISDTLSGQAIRSVEETAMRMRAIEEAMVGFSEAYGRVPCPADGNDDIGAAAFGQEAATPGTCTSVNIMGPTAAPVVVAGVVPTRALQLPDDYMFDGWGRRITYAVDQLSTASLIGSANGVSVNGTAAIFALISHGPNGHGAFPGYGGSTVAGRMNSGSTDANEDENASIVQAFDQDFIQADRTGTFDDIVRFKTTLP